MRIASVAAGLLICMLTMVQAQTTDILFLGNSYTYGNDLPTLFVQLANSGGKDVNVASSTPGGCTLGGAPNAHTLNQQSQSLLKQGDWEYVVMQEQRQIPVIPQYATWFFYPGAQELNDTMMAYNSCAKAMMFMTWGRRFGGQQCDGSGTYCSPNFVDFSHYQDSLNVAYQRAADLIGGLVSPVGMAWKEVIEDTNIVLHTGDNSHPNLKGSYLAACVFYAAVFRESPIGLGFTSSLTAAEASYFQTIADDVVMNNLATWNLDYESISAEFTSTVSFDTVSFTNMSDPASSQVWDFGDGQSDTAMNPTHVYQDTGMYVVTLTVMDDCSNSATYTDTVYVTELPGSGLSVKGVTTDNRSVYPNPVHSGTFKILGDAVPWRVVSLEGRVLLSGTNSQEDIDVSDLESGVYLLLLEESTGLFTQRVVVK